MNKENDLSESNVVISSEVVSKIIKTAALEVDGVAYISGVNSAIKGVLSKKSVKGVSFKADEESIKPHVGIAVYSGSNAIEVARKVQSKIKDNIESMTGYECADVDVDVIDIVVKENKDTEVE